MFLLFFEKLKEVRVKDKNFLKKAQKLKIIRDKYDALLDKTYEDQGTKYLSFSGSCHTYFEDYAVDILSFIEQEDIYSEYDRAIIDLGLAPHMRKSYEN